MDRSALNTVTDTESWFTLKLSVEKRPAAAVNISDITDRSKVSSSRDMFTGESYQKILTEEIKKQMKERMEEDKTVVYWAEKDEFGKEFVKISGDRNFYWNKDGNLVIAFDKYEVGPGSSGEPEFVIEWDLIENIRSRIQRHRFVGTVRPTLHLTDVLTLLRPGRRKLTSMIMA
ncbi:MAG: RsiV family protein [Anaerovoracaceae bacterium]